MCEVSEIFILESCGEAETHRLGHLLGQVLPAGSVVALKGDLGTGKSVFARGVLRGMGVNDPYLTSPTFTILNHYGEGRLPASHFDFYRLEDPEELVTLGGLDYLPGDGVALVEWPEKAEEFLPSDRIEVCMADGDDPARMRRLSMNALGPVSTELLHEYRRHCLG